MSNYFNLYIDTVDADQHDLPRSRHQVLVILFVFVIILAVVIVLLWRWFY